MNNNSLKIGYHPISVTDNYGYYIDKVPNNVLNELTTQVNNLISNFNSRLNLNDYLEGEIQHEYDMLSQNELKQYIKDLTTKTI
jgi:hypothetical protein